MPSARYGIEQPSGGLILRRIVPLFSAMLASAVLFAASASSAAAEPVGLFIGGSKSEEASKQPKFEAEKYPATIKGTSSTFEFTAQLGKLKCAAFNLSGSLTAANSELSVQQVFSLPCSISGMAATIADHGCTFKLHVLNAGPPYVGTTDLVCPAGVGIEFGTAFCTLTLVPQTGVAGVSFTNTGAGSARAVTVNFNLTTMKYAQGGNPVLCKPGEYTNGVFAVKGSLSATK